MSKRTIFATFIAVIISFYGKVTLAVDEDIKAYDNRVATPGLPNDGLSDSDWTTYNGAFGWRYSKLDKINKENVNNLAPAWMHQPGKVKMGLQVTPMVADGIVYYTGSYNVAFAVDGYTGDQIWKYTHEFTELGSRGIEFGFEGNALFFTPYSRGLAVGNKGVYMGTLDGQGVALDKKTGEVLWKTPIVNTERCNCNFTSGPVVAGDVIVYGPAGSELFAKGAIYGLSADTGEILWEFETLRDHPDSWLPEHRETGGGFGWLPGQYDAETDTVYWGIGNPAPDWDDGDDRPGDNKYTSGIVALSSKTGQLKWYHQQVPHDVWDMDASGEFVFLHRDGRKLMSNLNKNGYVYVYDRDKQELNNVWKLTQSANWAESVDEKTGEIYKPFIPPPGKEVNICPWVGGVRGWGAGSYNPHTGLWYTFAHDYCLLTEVIEGAERIEGNVGMNAMMTAAFPPEGEYPPRLVAADPATGKIAWQMEFDAPHFGTTLTTASGLVFYGKSFGSIHAIDADNGEELWSFNTGSGHRAGIVAYEARGEQFILAPSGCCGAVPGFFMPNLDARFAEINEGAVLVAFKLYNQ